MRESGPGPWNSMNKLSSDMKKLLHTGTAYTKHGSTKNHLEKNVTLSQSSTK